MNPRSEAQTPKLTKDEVEHVAKLARIMLTSVEIAEMSHALSVVLDNFAQISNINTDNVIPLVTPVDSGASLREDLVRCEVESEKLLSNAPEKTGRLFKVPPVV